MLWLALHLPWLPLEAVASGAHALPRCVMHEHAGQARVVLLADAAATAAGVVPGMSLASALALLPALLPLARDPAREHPLMQMLALAAARYTPQLVVETQLLKLEVQASLRLFGGLPSLLRSLRRSVDALQLDPRLGIAPTATAAALLARCAAPGAARATTPAQAQRRLDALPLAPAAPALAQLLHGIGCRTLGDVRALPRTGLQRRGGAELLALLDRAYGDAPDPQTWFEPPRTFAQTLDLMQRADDAALLDHAAQRLLQALAGWLAHQWLAASAFSLWLQHQTRGRQAQPPTRLRIELGQPSRDAAQLAALLRERLSRCVLPAPVYGLELRLDEAVALAGHAAALPFGSDRSGARWHDAAQDQKNLLALLDRLSARLGAQHVQRWAPIADHRPEKAARSSSASDTPARAIDTPPLPRPAWLLPEPLRLAEHQGRPVHGSPLALRSRPERIEAGWFDGAPVCRDYHVAEGRDHRLRWVFHERRGAQCMPSGWFLHGLFA
jgi:protein ImuB